MWQVTAGHENGYVMQLLRPHPYRHCIKGLRKGADTFFADGGWPERQRGHVQVSCDNDMVPALQNGHFQRLWGGDVRRLLLIILQYLPSRPSAHTLQ